MKGKIVKGIAGFYYVHVPKSDEIFECKAKGLFRIQNIKPLVGDDVEIDISNQPEGKGVITRILPRKNEIIRPAVANVDQAMLSLRQQSSNKSEPWIVFIMMQRQKVHTIICFNKRILSVERK